MTRWWDKCVSGFKILTENVENPFSPMPTSRQLRFKLDWSWKNRQFTVPLFLITKSWNPTRLVHVFSSRTSSTFYFWRIHISILLLLLEFILYWLAQTSAFFTTEISSFWCKKYSFHLRAIFWKCKWKGIRKIYEIWYTEAH